MSLASFQQLVVWQKSMELVERCYALTARFGRSDQIGLGHDIRKSSVSIPSNIAEGFGRHRTAEYVHHLRYAVGSNNELRTQLELARRVGAVTSDAVDPLLAEADEVGRLLSGLIRSLRTKTSNP